MHWGLRAWEEGEDFDVLRAQDPGENHSSSSGPGPVWIPGLVGVDQLSLLFPFSSGILLTPGSLQWFSSHWPNLLRHRPPSTRHPFTTPYLIPLHPTLLHISLYPAPCILHSHSSAIHSASSVPNTHSTCVPPTHLAPHTLHLVTDTVPIPTRSPCPTQEQEGLVIWSLS